MFATSICFVRLLRYRDQMTHLVNHAARRRRIRQLDRVIQSAQPHALDNRRLLFVESDGTLHERHLEALRFGGFLRCFFGHKIRQLFDDISSTSLPRSRATAAGSLRHSRPLNVARTTLCGFAEPSDLVSTLCRPAASTTARTAPPAIMPVPSGAGFNSTLPDPNLPTIACGIVVPASGTRISPFLAASIPFLMADGTSFALPTPNPTTPWPSPTTTSALKLRFLPPFTTFVTRLIDTTVSLMSSCDGSIFSRVRCISPRTPVQLYGPHRRPLESGRDRDSRCGRR